MGGPLELGLEKLSTMAIPCLFMVVHAIVNMVFASLGFNAVVVVEISLVHVGGMLGLAQIVQDQAGKWRR